MLGLRPAFVFGFLASAGSSIALLHCGGGDTVGTASFGGDILDATNPNDVTADDANNDASTLVTSNLDAPAEVGPGLDASDSATADADAIDGSDDAAPCTANSDCDGGTWCLYKIGDCSTKGRCLSPSSLGAMCNVVVSYCGCNGKAVGGLCGPPYAFGPTLGRLASPCEDSGM